MSYRAICITATELILLYHLYQCNRTKCQGKSVHEEAKCLLILNTSPITTSTQLHIPYSVMLYPNLTKVLLNCHSFIHSIGVCRMQRFLPILRSFFHSPLLCTFSCHPSQPAILPSSLTSSCHLFLGLPLSLVASKFIYI